MNSVAKMGIRSVMAALDAVLPSHVYRRILKVLVPTYKTAARWLYLTKGAITYGIWNPAKWKMVKLIHTVFPYTLVGTGGLEATYLSAKKLEEGGIEGDFVELGVARGGCAALMGHVLFDSDQASSISRKLWLFDSFEGLPEPGEEDYDTDQGGGTGDHIQLLEKGDCLGTLGEVQALMFDNYRFPKEQIEFVQGWFEDTVFREGQAIEKIALLRLDGDWYASTKICLEGFYDRVVSGGIVIIDDYDTCYGCKRAVEEFFNDRGVSMPMIKDGRGGRYFEKTDQTASNASKV
jgi:O-methyltransferase